jgi:hypothetical protein
MGTPTAPGVRRPVRPRTVELALGAILLRCLLALAAAFALFGSKDELRRTAATLHPEWSAATLAEKVDSELRSNVVLTLAYVGLVLLIAKYIRDGRNWARWLYIFVAFLVAGDVFRLTGFFSSDNLLFRLLSGFTGLASLAAIVLLVLPPSTAYFRPAGESGSPFGALFGGRAAMAARDAADRRAAEPASEPAAAPVLLTKPASEQAAPRAGTKRAPRAKSRKQAPQ